MNSKPDKYGIVPFIAPLPAVPNYDVGDQEQQVELTDYEYYGNSAPEEEKLPEPAVTESTDNSIRGIKDNMGAFVLGGRDYPPTGLTPAEWKPMYDEYMAKKRAIALKPGTGVTPAANMSSGNL